jgi:hypothetical protein
MNLCLQICIVLWCFSFWHINVVSKRDDGVKDGYCYV